MPPDPLDTTTDAAGGPARDQETQDVPGGLPGPAVSSRPGRVLAGRYRLESMVGRGGIGVVMRALDLEAERPVAIKLLLAADLNPARAERFRREGEIAAALNHPGVVRVHAAGIGDDGRPFLVYELVEGARTLQEVLPEVDLPTRVELIRQAAEGLGAAHAAGIVHRDVKPENVLIDGAGRARVTDFGAALQDELSRLTLTGAIVGTPAFMSPEQLRGEREGIGPATDVWALGVMLYEAATGESPFPADSLPDLFAKVERGSFAPPSRVQPGLPPGLVAVILRCLEHDPARRYPDGAAVARALETAFDPPSRSRAWVAAGVAALAVVAAAGLAVARSGSPAPAEAPAPPPASSSAAPSPSAPTTSARPTPAASPSARAKAPNHPLWRLKTGPVQQAVWALGGARIATRSDTEAVLWDARYRVELKRYQPSSVLYALSSSRDGERVAFGGANRTAWIVGARDGAQQQRLLVPGSINVLAFSPDDALLAAGGEWPALIVFDRAGEPRQQLPNGGAVHTAAWSPDGKLIALGGEAGPRRGDPKVLRLWDRSRAPPARLFSHDWPERITRIVFDPDRPRMYVGDALGGLTVVDFEGRLRAKLSSDEASTPLIERAHLGRTGWLTLGPRGRRLLSTDSDTPARGRTTALRVWDLKTRRQVAVRRCPFAVGSSALSADGTRVLLALKGAGRVEVWAAASLFR